MANKQTSETEETSEFDLKHRITGAAVLLFLGALVLPWLLGPPSEASKVGSVGGSATPALVGAVDIEPIRLGSNPPSNTPEIAETVYISKITPLDAQSDKELVAAANKAADKPEPNTSNKEIATSDSKNADSEKTAAEKAKAEKVKEVASASESATTKANDKKASEAKKAAQDKKAAELAKAKKDKEKRAKEQREKELQEAVAAESSGSKAIKPAVDVGWVVQVGLFTEKSRALALISELKNKGFTASNSVVDTNRGPKTGTRVWLGPFAKRSAAQTEQKRLKSKAGKDGFIRVYP